jgi:hypothetical protein
VASEWLVAALSKLGHRLIRPRDQKTLNDHSSRQTNILSKVENTFIIHLPDKGEYLVGDYREIPDSVRAAIQAQLESQGHRAEAPTAIRILRDDFSDDINEFQAYLEREDILLKTIEPFLEPQYSSILRLAAYAKSCYENGKRTKGDEIRNQVGLQYGRAGRKLCNLYLKEYVSDMFQHYLEPILTSETDNARIRTKVNDLLRVLIRFSENVHFIHQGLAVGGVVDRVREAISSGALYIALHAAGARNVKRTDKIIQELGLDFLRDNGYDIQLQPAGSAKIPFLDVYITQTAVAPQEARTRLPR